MCLCIETAGLLLDFTTIVILTKTLEEEFFPFNLCPKV